MSRPVTKYNYLNLPIADETMIFQPTVAKYLGINKAAIFYKVWYWTVISKLQNIRETQKTYVTHCEKNKYLHKKHPDLQFTCKHVVEEGINLNWAYNTYEKWQKQFPWLSVSAVQKIFLQLEKEGFLISGSYNKLSLDKTKWYTISPNAVKIFAHYLSGPDVAHLEANYKKAKDDYKPHYDFFFNNSLQRTSIEEDEDEIIYFLEEDEKRQAALDLDRAQP